MKYICAECNEVKCSCLNQNGCGPICTIYNIDFKECGLQISILNICHLLPKLDEIKYLFPTSKSTDIFGVCETFLSDVIPDTLIQNDNCVHVRRDRKGKKGRGIYVRVYISDKLPFHRRSDLASSDIESIWIEIKYDKRKPFLLNVVYRPPDSEQIWIDIYKLHIAQADSTNCLHFLVT